MHKGTQETLEVLHAMKAIAVLVITKSKNASPVKTVVEVVEEFFQNEEFKQLLQIAVANIQLVPAELGDIDLSEGFELGKEAVAVVLAVAAALKAPVS